MQSSEEVEKLIELMYSLIKFMSISTDHLFAFLLVHETGSFTEAASQAGLTQSALSQKIKRLEDGLEATLFVRKPTGPELTAAGEQLLSFARQQLAFEQEFLQGFQQNKTDLAGVVRIAGFSSVMRSVVIPSFAGFMRQHPRVQIVFSQHEMGELPNLLKTNAADLILLDYEPSFTGMDYETIGKEHYVVIESSKHETPPDLYLDHGPNDNATDSFFRAQGGKQRAYRRGFMGDVYGILDGVAHGVGRAVMSAHLVQDDRRFKQVKGHKTYERPLCLVWNQQAWYPKLQETARKLLITEAKRYL
mgnify:CR=1 FL=1